MGLVMEMISKLFIHILSFIICCFVYAKKLLLWFKLGNAVFQVKHRPTQPAILADARWGTHGYLHLKSQGIKIHYVEKGDRSKPLMVCFHGFPDFWFSWRYQLEEFSSDHWVVAVDMRGYGDSDKPSSLSDYSLDKLVEDLQQIVLELGKLKGLDWNREKCTVMAHDWGGVLTWLLVSLHPHLFKFHISLNGPNKDALEKHREGSFKQKIMSWYIIFYQIPWIPEFLNTLNDLDMFDNMPITVKDDDKIVRQETLEAYKYTFGKKGAFTGPLNYYRNMDSYTVPVEISSSKISVPTLIIWGTEDKVLEKPIADLSAEMCENVQIEWVPYTGHWVHINEFELVNRLMRKYLENNMN